MRRSKSSPLARGLMVVLIVAMFGANMGGCNSCPFGGQCEDFRDAANPSIQSGIVSIVTGLINGVFALINTGSDTLQASSQTSFSMSSDPNNP